MNHSSTGSSIDQYNFKCIWHAHSSFLSFISGTTHALVWPTRYLQIVVLKIFAKHFTLWYHSCNGRCYFSSNFLANLWLRIYLVNFAGYFSIKIFSLSLWLHLFHPLLLASSLALYSWLLPSSLFYGSSSLCCSSAVLWLQILLLSNQKYFRLHEIICIHPLRWVLNSRSINTQISFIRISHRLRRPSISWLYVEIVS